jgi:hypothetical protein
MYCRGEAVFHLIVQTFIAAWVGFLRDSRFKPPPLDAVGNPSAHTRISHPPDNRLYRYDPFKMML